MDQQPDFEKAFEHGLKNIEFHLANRDALTREANSSLTIITTAMLGATGYAAHLIEVKASWPLVIGVGAVALHLLLVAGMLVHYCLIADDLHPPTNEPKNLTLPGLSWKDTMEQEVHNLTLRIHFNTQRNKVTGKWLNRIRYATFVTPLTFIIIWALASALRA